MDKEPGKREQPRRGYALLRTPHGERWLRDGMNIPDGWTDDMRVTLRQGRTEPELVVVVMGALMKREDLMLLVPTMHNDFGMSDSDIMLAFDRIQGGIVRAITGNSANEPSKRKDPLAWHSFQMVWKDLPRKSLFSTAKLPSGPWYDWFEEVRAKINNSQQSSAVDVANRAAPEK